MLPFLREGIEWRRHDLLDKPPPGPFDAIFLRNNLLTYYRKDTRKEMLPGILGRLAEGGFLIVGSHERLPDGFEFMFRDPESPHVYIREASLRG